MVKFAGDALRGIQLEEGGLGAIIATKEGDMLAREGDWIIKGVAGEFYPCKPEIFAATYEPVEDEIAVTFDAPVDGEGKPFSPKLVQYIPALKGVVR